MRLFMNGHDWTQSEHNPVSSPYLLLPDSKKREAYSLTDNDNYDRVNSNQTILIIIVIKDDGLRSSWSQEKEEMMCRELSSRSDWRLGWWWLVIRIRIMGQGTCAGYKTKAHFMMMVHSDSGNKWSFGTRRNSIGKKMRRKSVEEDVLHADYDEDG